MQRIPIKALTLEPRKRTTMRYARESIGAPLRHIVSQMKPTIWFKPLEVFELSFADLSLSRAHTVGAEIMEDPDGRGIALRFPRFKRRRPDKSIEQATTPTEEVAHLLYQRKSYK
jgi:DNA ligase-1